MLEVKWQRADPGFEGEKCGKLYPKAGFHDWLSRNNWSNKTTARSACRLLLTQISAENEDIKWMEKGRKCLVTLLMELFEMKLLKHELISDVGCFWSPSCFFMRRKARGGTLQHCFLYLTCRSNTRSPKWNHSPKVWTFHCPSVHIPWKTEWHKVTMLQKAYKKPIKCLQERKHWGLGAKLLHQGHSQEQATS